MTTIKNLAKNLAAFPFFSLRTSYFFQCPVNAESFIGIPPSSENISKFKFKVIK